MVATYNFGSVYSIWQTHPTNFVMEANTMNPDQTATKGAV